MSTERSALAHRVAEARSALASGKSDVAWQIMSELQRVHPDDSRVALETGLIALRSGRGRDALDVLLRATNRWPEVGMGWALLGEALAGQDDQHGAVASYRRAIALDPQNIQISAAAGMALAEAGDIANAIPTLSRAVAAPGAAFVVKARLAGLLLSQSDHQAAQAVFVDAVASIKANLAAGQFDEALRNEGMLDQWYMRPIEDEAHQELCFSAWRDAMTLAGEAAAATLPAPPSSAVLRARDESGPAVVGFFLHTASMLGHVELMLDYLEVMKNDPAREIEPHIYVFSGVDPSLQNEANRRGLPIIFVDAAWPGGTSPVPYKKLLWLREQLARDGIEALVWVSLPAMVHFGAALGVAPINIFWALRFRPVASRHVQGYVACASCFEREDMVNDRPWDVIPLAFRDLAGPQRVADVTKIRRDLGNPPIIFGTLARSEKMRGSAWLEAIGLTLKACPQALFLWTGRDGEDARVAHALREMRVDHQCRFIGWVNTRLYAQVLDIFLDTAPVGCGMTAMEAMAWGKPLVSFKDPLTNWGQCLRPVLEGRVADPEAKAAIERIFALGSDRELLAWTDTPQDYAALARRLAEDSDYRAAVGAAGRVFTARYFGDPTYAGTRFANVLRRIVTRAAR